MKPKGKLLIIGGAEFKGDGESGNSDLNPQVEDFEILRELLPDGKNSMRIEVITTASHHPEDVKKTYTRTFKKIGYTNVGFISINDKMEARNEKFEKRIEEACAVFFSGGNQFRISSIIGGTKIADILKDRYMRDKNFVIAGTSAGAMVIPKVMIAEGSVTEALIDTQIKTTAGIGILENCIVDTHFIKRGRFARLAHAVIINPGQLGIGLGEDTALIIRDGNQAECRGSGMVVVIDGKDIEQTNITDAEEGDPIFVENLKVHLLVRGCRFCISERRMEKPAIRKTRKKK
jgi:cyanophycinase